MHGQIHTKFKGFQIQIPCHDA